MSLIWLCRNLAWQLPGVFAHGCHSSLWYIILRRWIRSFLEGIIFLGPCLGLLKDLSLSNESCNPAELQCKMLHPWNVLPDKSLSSITECISVKVSFGVMKWKALHQAQHFFRCIHSLALPLTTAVIKVPASAPVSTLEPLVLGSFRVMRFSCSARVPFTQALHKRSPRKAWNFFWLGVRVWPTWVSSRWGGLGKFCSVV